MSSMPIQRLSRDEAGAVLVEVTVVMALMFVFILGSIDFLFAFYQWNAAAKAVQIGARIAAVSDPVAVVLDGVSRSAVSVNLPPGAGMPAFEVTCKGATSSCTCVGLCTGLGDYNAQAMNTIVFGRGSRSCSDATNFYNAGMCDVFSRIAPANVVITYAQ